MLSVLAGLALFLYGVQHIGWALKAVAGGTFRNILARVTNKPLLGLAAGAVLTTGLQSSCATTLFLAGMSEAGLISLRQAIFVILGADIGTTITVQLVSFNLFAYSPIFLAGGLLGMSIGATERSRAIGKMVLGLGLLFFGMGLMTQTMKPLGHLPFMQNLLAGFADRPILGILVSAVFTAIVRSSSTTIVLALTLATSGVISLNGAIPIILGANVGTCSTAMIATIGMGRPALRIAVAHISFKLAGVLIIFPFIGYFADLTVYLSNFITHDPARLVANAHTLFNVFIAFFFLPWGGLIARILQRVISPKERGAELLKFIRPKAITDTETALSASRLEVAEVVDDLDKTLKNMGKALLASDFKAAEAVHRQEVPLAGKVSAITEYLNEVRKRQLLRPEREEYENLMRAVRSLHFAYDTANSVLTETLPMLRASSLGMPVEAIASLRHYLELVEVSCAELRSEMKDRKSGPDRRQILADALNDALRLHEKRLKLEVSGAMETSNAFSLLMLNLHIIAAEFESERAILSHKS